jgi:hypothetical protein
LHVIPDNLEQVAFFMETLLDLDSLFIEEAIRHLRAVEQRKKPSPTKESGERLLLTEEEWLVRMKICDGSSSSSNSGTSNIGNAKSSEKNKGAKSSVGGERKSSADR